MKPRFNEVKTTQAAALFLKLRGGKMSYMKLIKLLYLLDREALAKWGRPVTFDVYISMNHGPVLSNTLNMINEGNPPEQESYWSDHISQPSAYSIELKGSVETDELSDAEIELINKIFSEYGNKNRWAIVEELHRLPEWQNPSGSAIPIEYHDILKATGKSEMEIASIEAELENLAFAELILK